MAVIFFLIMVIIILWNPIYCSMDHTGKFNSSLLKSDAKIVNITQKKPSRKANKIKTTIIFSDGFTFWAYDTKQRGLKLIVTPEMTQNMISRAIAKHNQALNSGK